MSFQNKQELLFFPATAEKLLTHIPPNYTAERKQIFVRIASTALLFVVLLPFALTDVLRRLRIRKVRKLIEQQEQAAANNSSNHKEESQKITKTGGKNKKSEGKTKDETMITKDEPIDIEQNVHVVLPWTVWSIFNIFGKLRLEPFKQSPEEIVVRMMTRDIINSAHFDSFNDCFYYSKNRKNKIQKGEL
jgi:hypothetical protein